MKKKSTLTSVNVVSIFSKTPPRITKVETGAIYDFIDVISITKQQEVTAKNASIAQLTELCKTAKDKIKGKGNQKQMTFEDFGESSCITTK